MVATLDMIGADALLYNFDRSVVIDSSLLSVENYTLEVVSATGSSIRVRKIIPPTDGLVTQSVILYVDQPTKGARYRLTSTNLRDRAGTKFGQVIDFIGRRTKLEGMLRSLPQHWDKRPDSVFRSILSAVSIEDDRIGGSRSDSLPAAQTIEE